MVAFGLLQILIGLGCAAFVLFFAAGSELAVRQGPGGGAALASSLIVYGVATVYFIGVGIGSIRRCRWARALSVVVSALWLAAGIVTTLLVITMPQTARLQAIGMAALIGVVFPLILFLFYRRDSVRLACEAADVPRWTDRVPLPVLAVVIVLAFGAVALVANLANPVIEIFGQSIKGAPAALTLLALAILCAWLAAQLYRLKESAWWTLVLLQVIGIGIAIGSMMRDTAGTQTARSPMVVAILVATWVAYFAYLLFIRRYFAVRIAPKTRREDAPRFT